MIMQSFPQEHELLRLCESEPQLTDRGDVPWFYNELTLTAVQGDDRVECTICPGYNQLKFRWLQGNGEQMNFHLDGVVEELRVETEGAAAALIATFREENGIGPLRIQFKPTINVQWPTGRLPGRLSNRFGDLGKWTGDPRSEVLGPQRSSG